MTMKVLGAILIIAGTGGVGFALTANDRRQEMALADLQRCLQWMTWELSYKMPSLAVLCRGAAKTCDGVVGQVITRFADELEQQVLAAPSLCMNAAISAVKRLPERAAVHLQELGSTLGQFDLEQQISGLEAAEVLCRQELEQIRSSREVRTRNYQTLSLCAGAALVIILL